MESFLSRYKNALVLIVVLLAQVIGVAIQVRRPLPKEHAQPDAGGVRLIRYWAISLVSPPERLVHWLGASILGVWDNYIDLIHVRQQNQDLQAELRRLRVQEGGIAEDARQGQRLQQLLAFKEKYVYQTLPAQIIGTSGVEQSRILSIDKGAKDGIAVDMPVITPNGIVGKVREVFPHTSQVLEITDPTSAAGVILATTRIRGILRGNALGQPQVVSVMPDERVKAGEAVVTSGGDQIFPRGLAVGYVDKVVVDPEHDPLVDVVIKPAANLSQLEEVLIITNMGAEVTPRQKLDMIQSEAIASAEQLRASEILAEKLPSRIDPDAPDSDKDVTDNSTNPEAAAVASPMRPPAALHPDRFSPNAAPPAANLTPGARLSPQSEGVVTAAKPRATTPATSSSSGTGTAASVPKKGPELVPDDGSRPPVATPARPVASTGGGATETRTDVPLSRPAVSAPAENGVTHDTRSAAPAASATHVTPAVETGGAPGTAVRPAVPKTNVVVDGPLPSSARRTTSSGAAGISGQPRAPQAGAAPPVQHGTNALPTTAKPGSTTPNAAPNTAQGQHPPPAHKGPELVPDDGSRPPPSMLKPKPQPQPQKATPPPQQQPQGAR